MGILRQKAAQASSISNSSSSSNSVSGNANNDYISNTYAPQASGGVNAFQNIAALLTGQGDTAGAQAGYQNYLNNAGFQNALSRMQQGLTGGAAASGILNSGATQKALAAQGAALNQQYFGNYLQQLMSASAQGLNAGNLIANTGNFSNSNSMSNSTSNQNSIGGRPSLFGEIGSVAGAFLSDRRLKTNIKKIDTFHDGLGIYEFNFMGIPKKCKGVMADEVAKLRPWALGPTLAGYQTVKYGEL